jgi:hypothetical protein
MFLAALSTCLALHTSPVFIMFHANVGAKAMGDATTAFDVAGVGWSPEGQ